MESNEHKITAAKEAEKPVQQVVDDGEEMEINLVELMYRLLENAKYIVLCAVVGALLSWSFTALFMTPMYTATSKLYVMNTSNTAINLSDLQIGTYLASDYQEVFKNWHVHEMVLQDLNLSYSYEELSDMLTVTNPSDTRILYISVTASDPQEAKNIADSYAKVSREFIAVAMETEEPNMFEEALLPTSPSSPNKTLNTLLGFMLGLLACAGYTTVKFIIDDRVRTSDDIERLNMTMLGMLPLQSNKPKDIKANKRGGTT